MKHRLLTLFVIVVLVAPQLGWAGQAYVVTLKSAQVPQQLQSMRPMQALSGFLLSGKPLDRLQSKAQLELLEKLKRYIIVTLPDGVSPDALFVEGVTDVRPLLRIGIHQLQVSNDSLVDRQWALKKLGAPSAWKNATGRGIVVGVIDTGVEWTHPDLIDALAISDAEDINRNGMFDPWSSDVTVGGVTGDLNGIDDDDNGVVDDVIGYDFVDQSVRNLGDDRDRDPVPFDEHGHGTSVAGVIAATTNNKIGIAGLAYGARVRVLRAFDATGNAEEDDIACAIVYAALTGVHILNMSFGDGVDSPLVRDAVRFAASMGMVMIASAGNTGTLSRQYPAGYDEVIAVASTNDQDLRSPFSSTGPLIALSAPGEGILTTAVGRSYRTVSGTSFSAPYVASVAAMLKEKFPEITPQEVRGTLQERSRDLGTVGWDPMFGAGRLQADATASVRGLSAVFISSPINDQEFNPLASPNLDVYGSSTIAPFQNYEIAYGSGEDPRNWTTISSSRQTVLNGLLGIVDLRPLEAGPHIVRLRVYTADGRTLDHHKRIVILGSLPLSVGSIDAVQSWLTDRRTPVVNATSSRPTSMSITSLDTAFSKGISISDTRRIARKHSIVLPDTIRAQEEFNLAVTMKSENGESVDTLVKISASTDGAPALSTWRPIGQSSWAGYVLNDVRDIYQNGNPVVIMNDLSSGSFGQLITMEFSAGSWIRRDSVAQILIPRGISDVNGNGRLEIFAHVVGRAVLFEQAVPGGNPFATILFADSTGKQNAAGVADIDGDGREELLLLSDQGCTAVTFRNGKFEALGFAENPTRPAQGSSTNRIDEVSVAVGDVDGDGRMELAFGDIDGDLVIATWNGRRFETSYTLETNGGGGSGYIAMGDIDGDGKMDVIHGVPDSVQADASGEYGRSLWTYRMIKSNSVGTYQVAWEDHFSGVRYGIGYRNGLGTGQLDKKLGDEIAICVFPKLYVFGWDVASKRVVPKLFTQDVVSPRFLIHDFNRNGINELGFGSTIAGLGAMTSFRFYEIDTTTRHPAPTSVKGRYVNARSILLDWMPVPATRQYDVYKSVNTGPYRLEGSAQSNSFLLSAPDPGGSARFAIVAIPTDTTIKDSQRSADAIFSFLPLVNVIGTDVDSLSSRDVLVGVQLTVRFSGPIAVDHIDPLKFVLMPLEKSPVFARSAVAGMANSVVLTFPPHIPSESYVLAVAGVLASDLRVIAPATVDLRGVVLAEVLNPIVLSSIRAVPPSTLNLTFSMEVDESALEIGNYSLEPAGRLQIVARTTSQGVQFVLHPDEPLTPRGVLYTLTASNITSPLGNRLATGAGSSIAFVVDATDVAGSFVYPHPISISRDEEVTFAGLTAYADVEILDGSLRVIRKLGSANGAGGLRWDVRNEAGSVLPPGLYFYRVDAFGETKIGKISITR